MKRLLSMAVIVVSVLSSCSDEPTAGPSTSNLILNINGLATLGNLHQYEGWLIIDGTPKSTGTFTVDFSGALSKNSFSVNSDDLSRASSFMLSIESIPDNDAAPGATRILAGDFSGGTATLNVKHSAAFGNDFTGASGTYMLTTPTALPSSSDGKSGVWFIDANTGTAGLKNLPALSTGWMYEGWAVINGSYVSTGKFTMTDAADQANLYSGPLPAPAYPGEDFFNNAPPGLSFPINLSGANIVLSIEPSPDNNPDPFNMVPLVGTVPANAMEQTGYTMTNQAATAFPTGTAKR